MLHDQLYKILTVATLVPCGSRNSVREATQHPESMPWQLEGLQAIAIFRSSSLSKKLRWRLAPQAGLKLLDVECALLTFLVIDTVAWFSAISPAARTQHITEEGTVVDLTKRFCGSVKGSQV